MTRRLERFEGRLFAEGGCLFMVVHANEATGVARVSCRVDEHTQVIEMPLSEVAKRVSSGAALILDNLNGPETTRRIVHRKDGWHFIAREGEMGPFDSREEAGRELVRFILCMQTQNGKPREPLRSGRVRRREQPAGVAPERQPTV